MLRKIKFSKYQPTFVPLVLYKRSGSGRLILALYAHTLVHYAFHIEGTLLPLMCEWTFYTLQ